MIFNKNTDLSGQQPVSGMAQGLWCIFINQLWSYWAWCQKHVCTAKKEEKKRGGAEAEIQEMNGECEENVTSRLKCPVDHFILQDISKYVGSVQIYAHGLW